MNPPDGSPRYYISPRTGAKLESVTSFLSRAYPSDYLTAWRAAVGEEEANRISKEAAERGTIMHNNIEHYLQGTKPIHELTTSPEFRAMRNTIDMSVGRIFAQEYRLFSDILGVAGTSDLLAEWDGTPAIIDWKTARRIKAADEIHHYFVQATLYSLMLQEIKKVRVRKLVVCVASVGQMRPRVFIEDRAKYEKEVLRMCLTNRLYPRI